MNRSRINIVHVRLTADKPVARFTEAFAEQLEGLDPDGYRTLEVGEDPQAAH